MVLVNSRAGFMCCFFFQAEDGIRDYKVTGVQTCALPIWAISRVPSARFGGQTELGLWPYRPPLDDLTVETLPRTMGAGRGSAGIPDDLAGMGETHRVARRHGEARLEAAARRQRRDRDGSWLRPHQGRPRAGYRIGSAS